MKPDYEACKISGYDTPVKYYQRHLSNFYCTMKVVNNKAQTSCSLQMFALLGFVRRWKRVG